ncbi:odorant receptor 85b [Stomoxys calcitrans]|uniref:Odorant receptor n=1 Tax=Stomoxys calcitrans TaxID=35570 RepID=A0A1I8PVT0_STOCA|nr:odorant receptor 85b [Stomoxys calcitrans]
MAKSKRKLAKFDDFLKLSNFFYTSVGVRPYEKPGFIQGTSLLSSFIFYFGVINMNCMLVCEIIYVLRAFATGENILQAIMTMSYIGFVLVGDFKMLYVWSQKSALTIFVQRLMKMFPLDLELQKEYRMQYYLSQCTTVTVGFSMLYMILIWTYNLFAITQYFIYDKWLQTRVVGQELPYTMFYVWDWRDNWSYYLMYFLQDVAGYTSAAGQISSDLMLCAFATQLVMHYDYVSKTMTNYVVKLGSEDVENMDKKINRNLNAIAIVQAKAQAEDMQFLQEMIRYHENLLNLSEELNNIFGVPLLLNFATSSFVICFVGFQMTIGAAPDTLIKLFLFLISSIAQVYLICHYGQLLIDASINVADAVYNQNWSNAEIRYQKMLVLMAERAQKPAQLKATTFVLISRGTMTDLMQLSYKFFALLRTMYVTK